MVADCKPDCARHAADARLERDYGRSRLFRVGHSAKMDALQPRNLQLLNYFFAEANQEE
jgi:hypothetical protein